MMPEVFISYAHQDKDVAHQLRKLVQAEGQTVFFDNALAAGEDYSSMSESALADAKAVVVLLSKNSNRSRWVDAQLRSVLQSGKVIIPVLLDEEATSNWVWPLISDRNAIKLESPQDMSEVVRQVNQAISSVAVPPSRAAYETAYRAPSRWVMLVVAVLSALVAALVTWFVK